MGKYDSLTKEELLRLMEARDRREAIRYGLVWETDGIETEQVLNGDYVALDLVPELCCGPPPWRNLVIEGDNFDALRALKPGFSGKVRCLATDPPYNTGNRDFLYNDRFIDKDDLWRHSKWLEFMFQRWLFSHWNEKIYKNYRTGRTRLPCATCMTRHPFLDTQPKGIERRKRWRRLLASNESPPSALL